MKILKQSRYLQLLLISSSLLFVNLNTLAAIDVGSTAPGFTTKTLSGNEVTVNSVNNKPIYIKFWATWCTYCVEEMPHLQQIFDDFGDNLEVLAINVGMNDSVARINRFMQKNKYSLPVSFDAQGELVEKYQVLGTPLHILIGTDGKIIHRSALITDDLHHKLTLAINEAKGQKHVVK